MYLLIYGWRRDFRYQTTIHCDDRNDTQNATQRPRETLPPATTVCRIHVWWQSAATARSTHSTRTLCHQTNYGSRWRRGQSRTRSNTTPARSDPKYTVLNEKAQSCLQSLSSTRKRTNIATDLLVKQTLNLSFRKKQQPTTVQSQWKSQI